MSFACRIPAGEPTELDERVVLDAVLAESQHLTQLALSTAFCEREPFAHLSDLELACAYQHGDPQLEDVLYCELHLRQLTPWKLKLLPAWDSTP